MTEPGRLPRAREALIPTAKLASYALDPAHERGRHKARVFASALGITATDWRYLHDQILAQLANGEVRPTRITPFGVAYGSTWPAHFVIARTRRSWRAE